VSKKNLRARESVILCEQALKESKIAALNPYAFRRGWNSAWIEARRTLKRDQLRRQRLGKRKAIEQGLIGREYSAPGDKRTHAS